MTYLKLTSIGDATAVVLPDDLLAQLGVGPVGGIEATVTPEGGVLLKARVSDHAKISSMIEDTMDRYDSAFRALAK